MLNRLGVALRETGQAVDRLGLRLQGELGYRETLSRHRRVMAVQGVKPSIGAGAYVAPNASVIGDTQVGDGAVVWYGAVVRGDLAGVEIGKGASVGDRAVIAAAAKSGAKTKVGAGAVVEQNVTLQGCTVGDGAHVASGAVIGQGAEVGASATVAPEAVVAPGTKIPGGELWAGAPATFKRKLEAAEIAGIVEMAETLSKLGEVHLLEQSTTARDLELQKLSATSSDNNKEAEPLY